MLPLFLRLGVIHLRAVIFHLRDRPSHFSSISLPLLFIPPYVLPLFLRLGVIHSRAVIFHLRDRSLPYLIFFSSSSFCFPLYGSSFSSDRGYTRERCYFSIYASASFHFSYIYLPLLFVSPYMAPVFPRLGVIHLGAAIFHLRERPRPFLI